ncbi:ferredoxin [Nocardia sp. CDC159]|uniref:Ferredoxin n=1 Tax=Nocardia pulmonis TaxID=2951408 RepID=A0A9X2EB53_9NOCA|nr:MULTISPECIES: ferredoxin [Nocardia]MCM6777051.1 ferredoxin [Nocardia pulmonis]MCM6789936.1 ferredoxin [Nocardia sp. CDC159]
MELGVNRDICIGAGMCALVAPDLFDQDPDDAKVLRLAEATTPEQRTALVRAVDACPSGALHLLRGVEGQ